MKQLQAFKFQLGPNGQQVCNMQRFSGACRFVFHTAQALQNKHHESSNKFVPYIKMATWLVERKKAPETQWLKVPSQSSQLALDEIEHVCKRATFPRFKKLGQYNAFRYPQGIKLNEKCNRILWVG